MFCGNCGKEIIGDTRFCQHCGAEQNAVVISAASTPVSAPISVPNETVSVSDASSVSSAPIETSMGVNVSESVPKNAESASASGVAAATAAISPEAAVSSLPTPNAIPTSNMDMPETVFRSATVQVAAPMKAAAESSAKKDAHHTEITIKDEEKRPPERKYSLKHIVMCLAAAAVMAVAAGVFAGLYFSVIL